MQTSTNSLTIFSLYKFEINSTFTGAFAGILLTSESGEETRKKIVGKTSDLKEDLDAKLKDVSKKIKNLENKDLSDFKDLFYDVKGKIKDQYAHLSDKVETIEKDILSKYANLEKEAKEKSATTKNI